MSQGALTAREISNRMTQLRRKPKHDVALRRLAQKIRGLAKKYDFRILVPRTYALAGSLEAFLEVKIAKMGISIRDVERFTKNAERFCYANQSAVRGKSIELSELAILHQVASNDISARSSVSARYGADFFRIFTHRLNEFFEGKGIGREESSLFSGKTWRTLMLDGEERFFATRLTSRATLMLRAGQAGHELEDIGLAIELWQDGDISPRQNSSGVVRLSDLMHEYKKF